MRKDAEKKEQCRLLKKKGDISKYLLYKKIIDILFIDSIDMFTE